MKFHPKFTHVIELLAFASVWLTEGPSSISVVRCCRRVISSIHRRVSSVLYPRVASAILSSSSTIPVNSNNWRPNCRTATVNRLPSSIRTPFRSHNDCYCGHWRCHRNYCSAMPSVFALVPNIRSRISIGKISEMSSP